MIIEYTPKVTTTHLFDKVNSAYTLNEAEKQVLACLTKLCPIQNYQNGSYSAAKLEEIQHDIRSISSHILSLYTHAVYLSYTGRLTELTAKSETPLNAQEAVELANLQELTGFTHTKLESGLPLTQKLSFDSKDGIKNYALYAAADTVNELMQKQGMHALISKNNNGELDGFLTYRNYEKGELLEDKDAVYVSQTGTFPLKRGKGKELRNKITDKYKNVILLTRNFNNAAQTLWGSAFEKKARDEAEQICDKLGYSNDKYYVYAREPND